MNRKTIGPILPLTALIWLAVATAHAEQLAPDEVREGDEALVWSAKMTCGTTEAGVYDDLLVSSRKVPLSYDNPLAGEYQDYVGGKYHAHLLAANFGLDAADENGRPPGNHYLQRDWLLDLRCEADPGESAHDPRHTVPGLHRPAARGRCAAQRDDLDCDQGTYRPQARREVIVAGLPMR
jgi:hypothetical protein